MSNTIDKVIKIALDEEGYLENPKKLTKKTKKYLTPRRMGLAVIITQSMGETCMNSIQR